MIDWQQLSYWGLFISSFLASSILPAASDGLLVTMLLKQFSVAACIGIATFGNWLGGLTSYYIGWLGKREWLSRWFGIKEADIEKTSRWIDRYGIYIALFCWLPFVGDPLVVALGFMKNRPITVALLMLIGRFLKYAALSYATLTAVSLS